MSFFRLSLLQFCLLLLSSFNNNIPIVYSMSSAKTITPTMDPTIATDVIGQPDLFSRSKDRFLSVADPYTMRPNRLVADNEGGLYVADSLHNRVLYFPPGANNGTAAIRVYGQSDMYSGYPNRGEFTNPTADSLYHPIGIAIASDGIYISDMSNRRVLFYPGTSTIATRVYGQESFTTSANNFISPSGICVDKDNNLYVTDSMNNRVLFFPAGSTTPTRVYGQGGSFTTNNKISPPTADSLSFPMDVVVSNKGVYIADTFNHRVLFYSGPSTTASMVYGQSDFVTDVFQYPPKAQSTNDPFSITIDHQCNLYVTSFDDNRVLFFPSGSTKPTRVYGQGGDFSTKERNKGGIGPSSLDSPNGITIAKNALFIADSGNSRVLKYPLTDGSASNTGPC